MKLASIEEAEGYLEDWYAEHTPASDGMPTVLPMNSMDGYGGWIFRADRDDRVSLVRVGPRGGLTWLITLTDEQIQELR